MDTWMDVILTVVATLLTTLIGVLGAWLTSKLSKKVELSNINAAQQELINMAIQTVGELKQLFVDDWKAKSVDGKLNAEQIELLRIKLLEKTKAKLSSSAMKLLLAAAVDVDALIQGAAEKAINGSSTEIATAVTESTVSKEETPA